MATAVEEPLATDPSEVLLRAKKEHNLYIQLELVEGLLDAPEARKEAIKMLKKLANADSMLQRVSPPDAQFKLAELYGRGLYEMPIDHAAAFSLYLQASKQMHPMATYRTAVCYEVGAGCRLDFTRAVIFYRKAALLGVGLAMHKLALILLYGKLGHPRNLKQGMTWLKRAANQADAQHPEAFHDLAQCYERQRGCPVVIPDERYALELYSRAAEYGFPSSQYRLGIAYEFGHLGLAVNLEESINFYGKAAEQGHPEAQLALSNLCLVGAGLVQSNCDAYLWAKRAADQHHPRGLYVLGCYYEEGVGIPQDLEKAKELYEAAKKTGSEQATKAGDDIPRASRCTIQ